MIGHPVTVESNLTACFQRCKDISSCAHWLFDERYHRCHVADTFAVPMPLPNASVNPFAIPLISGPVGCISGAGDKRETASTMLLQKRCYQNGVTYAPWTSLNNSIEENLVAADPWTVRDVLECQSMCFCMCICSLRDNKTGQEVSCGDNVEGKRHACKHTCRPSSPQLKRCELWEYNTQTNMCHFMATKPQGTKLPGDFYITGAPACDGTIMLQVSVTLEEPDPNDDDNMQALKEKVNNSVWKAIVNNNFSRPEELSTTVISLTEGKSLELQHCVHTRASIVHHTLKNNFTILATIKVFEAQTRFAVYHFASTNRAILEERLRNGLKDAGIERCNICISGLEMESIQNEIKDEIGDHEARAISQNLLTKTGGGRQFRAITCLSIVLVFCISMSAAAWRWKVRSTPTPGCVVDNAVTRCFEKGIIQTSYSRLAMHHDNVLSEAWSSELCAVRVRT